MSLPWSGARSEGLGLRVEGLGFRVQGLGFRVEGLGFRVEGLGCTCWVWTKLQKGRSRVAQACTVRNQVSRVFPTPAQMSLKALDNFKKVEAGLPKPVQSGTRFLGSSRLPPR